MATPKVPAGQGGASQLLGSLLEQLHHVSLLVELCHLKGSLLICILEALVSTAAKTDIKKEDRGDVRRTGGIRQQSRVEHKQTATPI